MKKSSKKQQHQLQNASDIKLPPTAHVPVVRCRVQLLGRAAPADSPDGLFAMQKPLHELYEDYSPVESVLTAYTSGLVLRTPANVDAGAEELWFPIQNLMECGAMKAIGGQPTTAFAPLSTVEAQKSRSPALFVFVFKRSDIPVSDCWAVECKSNDAAMALLTACQLSHQSPAGWASAVDRPPPSVTQKKVTADVPPSEEWDGAVAKEAALWNNNFPRDYYEKPPLQGFYYTPKEGLIQHYTIGELKLQDSDEEDMMDMPANSEREMSEPSISEHSVSEPAHSEPALSESAHSEPAMSETSFDQRVIDEETASFVEACRGCRASQAMYYPRNMGGMSAHGAPAVYPERPDLYRFPPGMMSTFVPESVIYPDDKDQSSSSSSSDSDTKHGKKKHKKKKKSKKSKKHRDKKPDIYHVHEREMIAPQDAVIYRRAPSAVSEEPFESHLPEPVEEYDPNWHYAMKSYVRDQHYVTGYTEPVSHRPYESHIDEYPPVDYQMNGSYEDDGLYERRLPVGNGNRPSKSDPKMLNRNFIIRQKGDYRRHL